MQCLSLFVVFRVGMLTFPITIDLTLVRTQMIQQIWPNATNRKRLYVVNYE